MNKFRPYQETAVKKGVEFLTNPKEKQGAIVYYAARFDYKCQKCQSVKVSQYKAVKR